MVLWAPSSSLGNFSSTLYMVKIAQWALLADFKSGRNLSCRPGSKTFTPTFVFTVKEFEPRGSAVTSLNHINAGKGSWGLKSRAAD